MGFNPESRNQHGALPFAHVRSTRRAFSLPNGPLVRTSGSAMPPTGPRTTTQAPRTSPVVASLDRQVNPAESGRMTAISCPVGPLSPAARSCRPSAQEDRRRDCARRLGALGRAPPSAGRRPIPSAPNGTPERRSSVGTRRARTAARRRREQRVAGQSGSGVPDHETGPWVPAMSSADSGSRARSENSKSAARVWGHPWLDHVRGCLGGVRIGLWGGLDPDAAFVHQADLAAR